MASTGAKRKEIPCLSMEELKRLLAQKKNGRPNYGAIQKYFRLQAGWTGCDLSITYSEALEALGLVDEDHLISQQWIYTMENENRVPVDERRRWILAQLLNIPPALFGLSFSSTLKSTQESRLFDVVQSEKIDVVAYRTTLETYNHSWMAGAMQDVIPDMKWRILCLQNAVLDARASAEKKKLARLLCEYYISLALIAQHMQEFDQSVILLSKAIGIAETNKLYDIWAYALRQRGMGYLDRAEVTAGLVDFAAAHHAFEAAVQDFAAARNLEPHLSSQLNGIVHLGAGSAYAYVARDPQELAEALKLVEKGGNMIGTGGDEIALPTKFDVARYHLDRGKTLMASPLQSLRSPVAARKELELASKLRASSYKVHQAFSVIRQADSYYLEGEYPEAVTHAEQALELVRETDATQCLARLENLYKRLWESSFGKSSEVTSFGIKLLKIQHLEAFA